MEARGAPGCRFVEENTTTKHAYTGQYSNITDFGLMFYNAR